MTNTSIVRKFLWLSSFILLIWAEGCEMQSSVNQDDITFKVPLAPDSSLKSEAVIIVGHRGNPIVVPENSLAGLHSCIELGLQFIEADVRITLDGIPVIIHDDEINRVTDGTGEVKSFTLEGLKKFRLKNPDGSLSNEKIPSLEEFLLESKGKIKVILDKAWPIREKCSEIIRHTNTSKDVVFLSRNSAREVEEFLSSFPTNELPQYIHLFLNEMNESHLDSILKLEIFAIDIIFSSDSLPIVSETIRQKILESGKKIMMNSFDPIVCGGRDEKINSDSTWKGLAEKGASILQTDFPEKAIRFYKNSR